MSAYAINAIMQQSTHSGHKLTVLLALADIADSQGVGIFPDLEELSRQLSMSKAELESVIADFIGHPTMPELEWWTAGDWMLFRLTHVQSQRNMEKDLWDTYVEAWAKPSPVGEPPKRPRLTYFKKPIPAELRWAVWERDNFTCVQCGTRQNLSIDHIIPESKGGPMTLDNLQTLCSPCNRRKGAKMPDEAV